MIRKPASISRLAVCAMFAIGSSVFSLAYTSEAQAMSEKKEVELGASMHPQILAQYGVYDNQQLQDYVSNLGQQLAAVSERSHLDFTFTVLDDDLVNAFALPGGYIYITRGLMAHLNSEAELASVLGHEIGHVTGKHASGRENRQKLLGGLSTVAGIATGSTGVMSAGNLLSEGLVAGYGRDQELEADEYGVNYMAKLGYPVAAAASSIEVLKRREQFENERARAEGRKPRVSHGFFASHPDNDKRLDEIIKAAQKVHKNEGADIKAEAYLTKINGMRFGPKGRTGVFRDNQFYHAQFGIRMVFPDEWRVDDRGSQLTGVSPDNMNMLQVFAVRLNRKQTPEDAIKSKLGLNSLDDGKAITIDGMPAYIATAKRYGSPFGPRPVRVAAVKNPRNGQTFVFAGSGRRDLSRLASDGQYISTIFSFARLKSRDEYALTRPPRLMVRQADPNTSISELATDAALPSFQEQQLRLLNGLYPGGEIQSGQIYKTVE